MKKKVLRLLLLLLPHVAYAVAGSVGSACPPVVNREDNIGGDTYTPLVQNYLSFTVGFPGMDFLSSYSDKFPVKKIDLHTLLRRDFAFLYAIRINQSRFAFCPGIGTSTLKYSFSGTKSGDDTVYKTLTRKGKRHTKCENIDMAQLGEDVKVFRSTFSVSYFDFLFRIRFNSVLDEPKDGFHAWLGAKVGVRIDASQAIHYSTYDESASRDDTAYFNLNRLAFGLQGGVGYHRFGLSGMYNFTPLFMKGEAPDFDSIRPWSLGIYVDLL